MSAARLLAPLTPAEWFALAGKMNRASGYVRGMFVGGRDGGYGDLFGDLVDLAAEVECAAGRALGAAS